MSAVTRSPSFRPLAFLPTWATVPENSCPGIRGSLSAEYLPVKMLQSVPQMPVYLTLIRTSSSAISGTGTCLMARTFGFSTTAAFIVFAIYSSLLTRTARRAGPRRASR